MNCATGYAGPCLRRGECSRSRFPACAATMPKVTSLPPCANAAATSAACLKLVRIANHMIRRRHDQGRVGIDLAAPGAPPARPPARYCGPAGSSSIADGVHAQGPHLFGHGEAMRFVAHHDGRRRRRCPPDAPPCPAAWCACRSAPAAASDTSRATSGHRRVPAPPDRITGITMTHDSLTWSSCRGRSRNS